jgi:hypothetical protein
MAGAKTGVRRAVTIIGTLICAAGTGYFMQNILVGNAAQEGSVQVASVAPTQDVLPMEEQGGDVPLSQAPAPLVAPVLPEGAAPTELAMPRSEPTPEIALPTPPASAPQPEPLPDLPVEVAALSDQPISPAPANEPVASPACEMKLYAVAVDAAMVDLALDAACKPDAQFTVHHNGMMFSGITDADGLSSLSVPALSEAALFIVSFALGGSAVASVSVEDLSEYDRAVVQWNGPTGFQIHALEYGADYDEPGHIWEGAAHDQARAIAGEGGFLTQSGRSRPVVAAPGAGLYLPVPDRAA